MRPSGSPGELERRRFRAGALLEEGYQPVDIARMVGVDRRSARRWKRVFLEEGQDSIKARPAPGRPRSRPWMWRRAPSWVRRRPRLRCSRAGKKRLTTPGERVYKKIRILPLVTAA
ncbi:MAG: helix-turn-helix domain-containing protein [Nitrospirae bacterium]|nr:helix-turn-helix domain-containing protein [Nitrospirota bacterium]